MPGNYEFYDPSANKLGSVICKTCWENGGKKNHDSMYTLWVSVDGRTMVWWLCESHADRLRTEEIGPAQYLKEWEGIVLNPGI